MNIKQEITIINGDGEAVRVPLEDLLLKRGPDLNQLLFDLKFETELRDADFELTLERMLSRIPDTFDKRQGSIIYDALAPAAVELTEVIIEREINRALSYASMSTGKWLDLRVAEHGIYRQSAVKAIRFACFYQDLEKQIPFLNAPLGSKYSVPNEYVNFILTKEIGNGEYEVTCEEIGEIGNREAKGTLLLPIDYLQNLEAVVLNEIIVAGEEEETDDLLYDRFVRSITSPPFGGNRADYEEYFRKIDGIGPVKLLRANPAVGYVTAIILGSDWNVVDYRLVAQTQLQIDPIPLAGEGRGQAPLAHIVYVNRAQPGKIEIGATISLIRGWSINQIQEDIEKSINEYLLELRKQWANYVSIDSAEYIDTIVRIAKIEASILRVEGVADVSKTTIDGKEENKIMEYDVVPILEKATFST